ncbi:type II toxin-antitoxin system VapC family toxin [Georgenia sp. Z1344]|uniref:type II toxin-antitoxin system VapC family toxin n=1 Tax=Georgenia sp. Z1344 TaxID=3416706 RepID=UPI003CF0EE0E
MIVLDTNVISEVFRLRPDDRVLGWLESLSGDVAVTAITIAELLAGVRRLSPGRRRTDLGLRIDLALRPYRETSAILAFDDAAAEQYAEVLHERAARAMPISTADAQIASICRSRGATCATRNVKDFAHTGINLVDPWSAG